MSFLKRLASRKSKTSSMDSNTQSLFTTTSSFRPTAQPATDSKSEAPPAYSAGPPVMASQSSRSGLQTAADSPYAFLGQFDTVFVIDDSGSMAGRSWRETSDALSAITPICTEQDADGIDVYFLNNRNPYANDNIGAYTNVTSTAAVQEIFRSVRPSGGTPTGTRLNAILKQYLKDLPKEIERQARGQAATVKPLNIIVITDGVATDDVESAIVSSAKKLDKMGAEPWQVGIQFFQVGQDRAAAQDLKELDDALADEHGVRDMVDTVPWSGVDGAVLMAEGIMKVTMGAINRRLDRKRASDEALRKR
ncbi:hypothetical protein OHC33_010605 [Knufia fluminis]|uniref:VWFA domain-containing protein n=1 Tax=Knufia fluminis TaxID=191047 RepID=A0AAN8EYM2_9EURO|nr:hypothetical protein OHC33_010605 [Knufia fluminis]